MPDPRRAHCRRCNRHKSECGPISWGGNCIECGQLLMTANIIDLHTHSGELNREHRRACVHAFGGVILSDRQKAALLAAGLPLTSAA